MSRSGNMEVLDNLLLLHRGYAGLSKKDQRKFGKSMVADYYAINYSMLSTYLVSMFKFIDLPQEIPETYVWNTLARNNQVVFYKDDKNKKFMVLPCSTLKYNHYGEPTIVNAFDYIGQSRKIVVNTSATKNEEEGVVMFLSTTSKYGMRLSSIISHYAMVLAEIDTTIKIRGMYQRIPVTFSGSDNLQVQMQHYFNSMMTFEPFVYTTKPLQNGYATTGIDGISANVVDVDDYSKELYELKQSYFNEFLQRIGVVHNKNEDKKERLTSDEVNINNDQVELMRYNFLNEMRAFCKKFNEVYNLKVWVAYRDNEDITRHENQDFNIIEGVEEYDV